METQKTLDAGESIFFNRELELIKARAYEVEYQDLVFRDLFPVSNEGGAWTEFVTVTVYDKVGMAKIIAAYSDDLPRADVSGKQITTKIHTIGTSFHIEMHEVAASAKTGKNIDLRRGEACTRATEEELNRIAFFGDTQAGLIGILNNPNLTIGNVIDNAAGTSSLWGDKTADEILFDINDMFASIRVLTLKKEMPTKLLLPVLEYEFIHNTPRSAFSDETILSYVIKTSQYLKSAADVICLNELAGAGPTGGNLMIVYDPDPRKLEMDIPLELEFLAPQLVGLTYKVPAWCRAGGLNVYYPLSILIREGL